MNQYPSGNINNELSLLKIRRGVESPRLSGGVITQILTPFMRTICRYSFYNDMPLSCESFF